MLSSKQVKYLKALAHPLKPIFQIGKAGLHEPVFSELDAALETRELIKISLLQNTLEDPHEAGARIARETHAELVQVIGRTLVIYRRSKEKQRIDLPRS
ncbi:ribosome assembly RNA-binding protein YhbY [Sporolactobacillus spathodeae]|uniref:RNA-binding protein n=1 Tax=Sporolactobacillus spathodeae TaxID=1465502 RepID=A0ABS2Q872_9BACL|nr:RNA-binding protein [Sporolactobacillus spathodeae]